MQDGHRGSVVRHESLESRVQGKLANAVRGGVDGKGSHNRDLAGGLLHFGRANIDLLRKRVLYAP